MAPQNTFLASNLREIRQRMARSASRAGRAAEDITLVAVSKTFPPEAIRDAYELGVRHFGENRVQEWESKRATVTGLDATWHLIGHLQSNKARRAANLFSRVDSVDSIALAQKLDATAAAEGNRLKVLIEVHQGGEETKSGVPEADLPALTKGMAHLRNLELLGLMTIPPYFEEPERVRPYFRRLRELRDKTGAQLGLPLKVLSMGMSHDFEIAIEEGATEIRVGTGIFGQRSNKL
ncbi:MAG TPA: YggS family pyridoxal phosphate-dependent enzyme [Candidatus Acidoferrales bacterium]|nr:YggS family pyridoxal phosphate-dependent enzyme [Candidatus Acidoferrales bacterium]